MNKKQEQRVSVTMDDQVEMTSIGGTDTDDFDVFRDGRLVLRSRHLQRFCHECPVIWDFQFAGMTRIDATAMIESKTFSLHQITRPSSEARICRCLAVEAKQNEGNCETSNTVSLHISIFGLRQARRMLIA